MTGRRRHFRYPSDGGYALAALQLKAQLQTLGAAAAAAPAAEASTERRR